MNMKTTKFKIILPFLLVILSTSAQELTSSKLDEMHAKKWQFMVEKAKLSSAETDAVYSIFIEYERAVWAHHMKIKSFYKSLKPTDSNLKPNYVELNNNYAELDLVQGRIFKAYHLKLQKVLQPENLFRYYQAEREFKRKLLQDMQGKSFHHSKKQ